MDSFTWSLEKNQLLLQTRGISFDEVAAAIEAGFLMGEMQSPTRPNQSILVVLIDGYPWDVPFVQLEDGTKFLKTAFPNRKRK